MTRFLHATALALVVLCPIGASAQQPPDQLRQWQAAPDGRDDVLNTAKQRLRLTPEQEQLWGRVDEALRKLRARARDPQVTDQASGDLMERLRRRAEITTERAEIWRSLADAVQPLWAMLSDEQKRDLAGLMRLAARGDDPRTERRDGDERGDRWDRGIQREGRGDFGGRPRGRMDRYDDERRYRRDRDDDEDGRDRRDSGRYGGWHDRYDRHDRFDPWIMRRERGWDDLNRDDSRRFEGRRGWRSERDDDRWSEDRRSYRDERRRDRFWDED